MKKAPPLKARLFIAKRKKDNILFFASCFVLISFIILIFGESQLRPIIKQAGAKALKNELTMLLNQGVDQTLSAENAIYSDFVIVNYNENGSISSISADTVFVNSFKTRLAENMAKVIEKGGDFNIVVPLGTLLGSELFSDRGLELTVESSTYGFAVVDVFSSFNEAGINQTVHRIYVEAELNASAYIGNYKVSQKVRGKIPIAETVIIGTVPNSYYNRE